MTYPETLEYLYSQMPEYQRIGHKAYKEGLDNSLVLDGIFNHPHYRFKSIHVGGTNGKGSVSHLLAARFSTSFSLSREADNRSSTCPFPSTSFSPGLTRRWSALRAARCHPQNVC